MKIDIKLEAFENHVLTLCTATIFSGAKLFMDDVLLKPTRGSYALQNNQGRVVELKIKNSLIDPVPKIDVDGSLIELAPRLKRYEYVWIGFTAILLFIGGIIGALCAFWAIYFNLRIFRNKRLPVFFKYVLTGIVSIAAIIAYFALGMKAKLLLINLDRKANIRR